MKYYKISGDFDHYDTCDIHIAHGIPLSLHMVDLDGSVQGDKWLPRIMVRHKDHPLGDYVDCLSGDILILTDSAIELLRPVMGKFEKLQLFSNYEKSYTAVNVLTVLNCVDYEKSEYIRFPQTDPNIIPRIMMFDRYVFRLDAIKNHHIFRIIDEPKSALFVDDVFVSEVENLGITGFMFKQVWDSEVE